RFPDLQGMHLPEKLYNSTMEYLEQIEAVEAVGIHMYRSDSRTDEELYEGICTEKYYEGAVRYVQEKYPDAVFYIFSNEPKWVKKWVDHLIKSQITEEMTRAQIKEMKKHFVMVETNTEYTGYLDMLLMSKCKHNIISNSSFSWWAAWLNDNAQKIVVAPGRWNNDNDSDDVFAKGMILVDAEGEVKRQIV
ncbi:MAG: alpha-1,2-fucosyltransferase, partial [Lachnospiraceae bacterium]|nr:alpha-1,2-fucosyltransferase [Lachnospiraceae bacterium]